MIARLRLVVLLPNPQFTPGGPFVMCELPHEFEAVGFGSATHNGRPVSRSSLLASKLSALHIAGRVDIHIGQFSDTDKKGSSIRMSPVAMVVAEQPQSGPVVLQKSLQKIRGSRRTKSRS